MRLITKYKLASILTVTLLVSVYSVVLQGIPLTDSHHFSIGLVASIFSASAGPEGFIITTLVFCLIPFLLHFSFAQKRLVLLSFMLILVSAHGVKTVLKSTFEAPRPFVETLVNLGSIATVEEFYLLSKMEKTKVIDGVSVNVDKWRTQQWASESDYSFPSGHMLFAVSVAIFWAPVLMIKKHFSLAAISLLWVSCVGASRLWLGMHRLEDLFASIFIAFILCLFSPIVVRAFWREFERTHRTKSHSANVASPW